MEEEEDEAKDEEKQMRQHANMAIVMKMMRNLDGAIKHLDESIAQGVALVRCRASRALLSLPL